MLPKLRDAKYQGGYRLHLCFTDGTQGEVDLEEELWGEVFEPLKDKIVFAGFSINADLGTVIWPNGADFAPEFLYQKLRPDYRLGTSQKVGAA